MRRCIWPKSEIDIAYHDTACDVPAHDDRVLFEFLTLEGAQAGLSWGVGKRFFACDGRSDRILTPG